MCSAHNAINTVPNKYGETLRWLSLVKPSNVRWLAAVVRLVWELHTASTGNDGCHVPEAVWPASLWWRWQRSIGRNLLVPFSPLSGPTGSGGLPSIQGPLAGGSRHRGRHSSQTEAEGAAGLSSRGQQHPTGEAEGILGAQHRAASLLAGGRTQRPQRVAGRTWQPAVGAAQG